MKHLRSTHPTDTNSGVGGITVQQDGVTVSAGAAAVLNFTGGSVTDSGAGVMTIALADAGGGAAPDHGTVAYHPAQRRLRSYSWDFGSTSAMYVGNLGITSDGNFAMNSHAFAPTSMHTRMTSVEAWNQNGGAGNSGCLSTPSWMSMGNGAPLGGFDFFMRVSPLLRVPGGICFFGMHSGTLPAWAPPITGFLNSVGFGFEGADANWQFFHNDGTGTGNKVNTFIPIVNEQDIIEAYISATPAGPINVRMVERFNNVTFNATLSTKLPSSAVLLRGLIYIGMASGSGVNKMLLNQMVFETAW